jgi:hypothetical protein
MTDPTTSSAAKLSLEARACLIADESCKIEFAGNSEARRAAVHAVALAHLRGVYALATGSEFYADTELANGA